MEYFLAWAVLYLASAGLGTVLWFALRGRRLFGGLLFAVWAVWLLVPWPIDERGHHAPFLIVVPIRALFEPGVDAWNELGVAVPATLGAVVAYCMVHAIRYIWFRSHSGTTKSAMRDANQVP